MHGEVVEDISKASSEREMKGEERSEGNGIGDEAEMARKGGEASNRDNEGSGNVTPKHTRYPGLGVERSRSILPRLENSRDSSKNTAGKESEDLEVPRDVGRI